MISSVFWGTMLIACAGGAQAGTVARIKVRLVNSAKAPAAALRLGQDRATHVLAQAGVEVIWQDCSAGDVGACGRPLEGSEFWLHVANWKPEKRSTEMLGFTALGGDTVGGASVAGVYYPKVREMAAGFQVEEGDVMGAALAHEIGHLLGGGHAPTGVMRAQFNRQCIVDLSQGGLSFPKHQAAQIRAAAMQRSLPEFSQTDSVRPGR